MTDRYRIYIDGGDALKSGAAVGIFKCLVGRPATAEDIGISYGYVSSVATCSSRAYCEGGRPTCRVKATLKVLAEL